MIPTNRTAIAIGITLGAALLIFAGYVWLALSIPYTDGERAGYVQHIAQRGRVCKTWEGEAQLISAPGTVAEKFAFTVRDGAVAQQLAGAVGQRVLMRYTQHKGVPGSCFGDTEYVVENVKIS